MFDQVRILITDERPNSFGLLSKEKPTDEKAGYVLWRPRRIAAKVENHATRVVLTFDWDLSPTGHRDILLARRNLSARRVLNAVHANDEPITGHRD